MSMLEAPRSRAIPRHENVSNESSSREQQLAHLQETFQNLPTAESLAELLNPSAPPLEEAYQDDVAHFLFNPSAPPLAEAYQDDVAHFLFNGSVIPSAPPMEGSLGTEVHFLSRPSQPPVYPSMQTHRTSNAKLFTPKAVPTISNNINFIAEATHSTYKEVRPPQSTYYTYENSTAHSRSTWPEHVLFNDNQKIGDRYAPDSFIPLYECISSKNENNLKLQRPKTLEVSNLEKNQMRQYSEEKKVHHMEFTQDGYRLKDYVQSSEQTELARRVTKWRNICSSSEKKSAKESKKQSTFSRMSQRLKSFFKLQDREGKRLFRLGGGKKTIFNKELETLYGPSHNLGGFKHLMVLDQNEIDLVGEANAQISDNAVFHLAFQMVYNYNKSLPKKFGDKNHVQLLHPSFLPLFLEHGMSEKLSEMTAFVSKEPCSRYLIPFLRGNHFALVHVGKVEEAYHMHVFDSLRPIEPNMPPVISNNELRKLARLLANGDVRTKITRVPEEHASMQSSAQSNDCGICAVENVFACLQYKDFPLDTALYENRKVNDHVTTLRRPNFKEQLQNWIGENMNTNLENDSDAPSTSTKKQSSIAFARTQRKRRSAEPEPSATSSKNTWQRQKERQETIRKAVQNHRLEENKVTEIDIDNEVEAVEAQPDHSKDIEIVDITNELDSAEIDNFEPTDTVSHKKKMRTMRGSQEDEQTTDHFNVIQDDDNQLSSTIDAMSSSPVPRLTDDDMLKSLLMQLDDSLNNVQDRATRNLLKQFKDKLSARLEDLDDNTETSVSSENGTLSEYEIEEEETIFDPNFWTERRKQNLIDSYDKKTMSFKELKKRFRLSENDKSARIQIARIRKCMTNKKWKKNEAYFHLTKRVSTMTEHRDEQRNDIHESDIKRLGFEQSICWGLKNFKASRKFVEKIKDKCSLVSRHVDGRISKRALLRQKDIEKNIADFKNNEVARIRNQYPLDRIFNVDQTGVVLEETRKRTLTKRGTKKVMRQCQRDNATTHSVTYNPCISGAGKMTGKLFLTLHEPVPPRSFGQMVAPFTNLHVTHSKSGKMSARLAEEWMEKCLLPSIPDGSVLLLDSWTGFNSMKMLRSVARKNLEIVTFPERTTSELQPLDLFFNRQLKSFLRKLQDEIRLKMNTFTISIRNNLLKIASFTDNQFRAPRFAPFIQRGFYELGVVTTRPPTFDTPAEFCFNPAVAKKKCETCRHLCFVKCAYCEKTYCIQCGLDHFH